MQKSPFPVFWFFLHIFQSKPVDGNAPNLHLFSFFFWHLKGSRQMGSTITWKWPMWLNSSYVSQRQNTVEPNTAKCTQKTHWQYIVCHFSLSSSCCLVCSWFSPSSSHRAALQLSLFLLFPVRGGWYGPHQHISGYFCDNNILDNITKHRKNIFSLQLAFDHSFFGIFDSPVHNQVLLLEVVKLLCCIAIITVCKSCTTWCQEVFAGKLQKCQVLRQSF